MLVDGSCRLCSAGRATVLPQVLFHPITDLLHAMGSDNWFLSAGLWAAGLVGCVSGSRDAKVSADIFSHPSV